MTNNRVFSHTRLRVFTAAKRMVGLAEVRNICKTETAGCSSLAVTLFRFTIALAASYTTICGSERERQGRSSLREVIVKGRLPYLTLVPQTGL